MLRERKRAATRASLQREALRLFAAHGYDRTSVDQIAAAAGVSAMTFFRYFPTKEDVVLEDDYDALLAQHLARQPADLPALQQVQVAVRESLAQVDAAARDLVLIRVRLILQTPALRARLFGSQTSTEALLNSHFATAHAAFAARVLAAACLAALTTAVLAWAEANAERSLPDVIDDAFEILRHELT
jgi:AcrR family transcriptional regulator